jgi:hypothetical protein
MLVVIYRISQLKLPNQLIDPIVCAVAHGAAGTDRDNKNG